MKIVKSLLTTLLLFAIPVLKAGEAGPYDYRVYESSASITHYEPDDSSVLIVPDELEGMPVTSIGWEAFKDCDELTEVVLPEGVTSVGQDAFNNCRNLESIALPSTLTHIGDGAFFNCRSLTRVTFPDGLISIGNGAFLGCSLTEVKIPAGVATIGTFAFSRCASLEAIHVQTGNANFASLDGVLFNADFTTLYRCPEGKSGNYVIPEGVTSLAHPSGQYWAPVEGSFENCTHLDEIILPTSLTSIGGRAFHGCHALTTLSIPEQVSEIIGGAFDECPSLTSIEVDAQNPHFSVSNGVLLVNNGTELVRCLESKTGHLEIPVGVTTFRNDAFNNCAPLTSIAIPEGVAEMPSSLFFGCSGLEQVHLPASLTGLNSSTFSSCLKLTAIEVADESPTFRSIDGVVYNSTGTELLFCPTGKTGTFTIPNGVVEIANSAFSNSRQLSSILIPGSVEILHPWLFAKCAKLESIEIFGENPNYTSIDGVLHDKLVKTTLFCPKNKNGSYRIPDGVEKVSWSAFEYCDKLTKVVLPDTVTNLESRSFYGCSALQEIEFSENLIEIGDQAFGNCTSLIEITIPKNTVTIYRDAFIGNISMESIQVVPGNESYSSVDGVLFTADGTTLIRFPRAKTGAYTVPEGVTRINGREYHPPFCGVGGWGWWGFGASYSEAVLIGDDWVIPVLDWGGEPAQEQHHHYYEDYYGEGAFEGSHGLTSITIPEGVETIGHFAFYDTRLVSVDLPASLGQLDSRAFSGNNALRHVRFNSEIPSHLGWELFTDTSSDLTIDYEVKIVSLTSYQAGKWSLEWTSIPGDLYEVEYSEDLRNWEVIESNLSSWGGRGYHTITTGPDLRACSFRVRRIGRE